ncbi:transducin beta-like protein 3 [Amia ocellicauda]|uniref:transducin beta-like protein 3 n=1 Tax=Amia ocellicauda TaxID=2972642 RepID=UPI0034641C1C
MDTNNLQFKTNYAVCSKIEPFYKGGKVQVSTDEKYIFCTCGTRVNILEIATGKVIQSIEQDDQEDITSFALSPDDEVLVTASRALLLKQWEWREGSCSRTWRAIHNSPVASMTFDPTSTLLATGGCDGTIKLWDVLKQYCTHNLKGSSGVVHLVQFHPDISLLQLFSSSMDSGIRVWDLRSSQCVCVLTSHYSAVTSLAFTPDGSTLISSGRDKICTVWDLKTKTATRTVPVFEAVEAVVLLPQTGDFSKLGVQSKGLHFITAGSKGVLRVWETSSARCVFTQTLPVHSPMASQEGADGDEHSLTYCLPLPSSARITTVTAEHNFLIYDLPYLTLQQQFVGYNDEVLDVKFLGPTDSHIVVATNSPQLKVFELASSSCQILYGHTDTILSLDVFRKGSMFASCAKDNSIRLWRMNTKTAEVCCVAQGFGHANAVGTICCSRLKESFVATGSQDCTIKVWDLPVSLRTKEGPKVEDLTARVTEKGHDKDVNSVAISPNDKLLASGSQDRTAKLWTTSDLALRGVFRGHRRGVWCVQFSPMDQVLATSSADGSVRLWGLHDFSCLKTFEGHDASVLKIIFVSRGTQLLTSGSDGLLKLWTIKTNECMKTLDAHQDKVWGLHANRKDDQLVTGSADSCIVLWKDVTEAELAEEQAKQEDQILKQQELSNLLHEKKYLKALGLAISLGQPHTVLRVIKEIRGGEEGPAELQKTILKLRQDQKEAVLSYCSMWNTNARNCQEAQAVIQVLLTHESPEQLVQYKGARGALEGLIPYTERHFQRIGRLLQASMFVDYMWQNMRLTGKPRHGEIQDEEMDTSSLSQLLPLFTIDKQPSHSPGKTGAEEEEEEEEEEIPEVSGAEDDEGAFDSDDDVCAVRKVTTLRENAAQAAEEDDEAEEEEEAETGEREEEEAAVAVGEAEEREEGEKENVKPSSLSEGITEREEEAEEEKREAEEEQEQMQRMQTRARKCQKSESDSRPTPPCTRAARLRR